ncbi:DUF6779 domain-containing protein [Gordonia alkaliphila]|uniref:DUF6779 domain-containing protein n=1 Tax=Gordonia alkaliphila TaxID=1053547 RepID=UPI0031E5E780
MTSTDSADRATRRTPRRGATPSDAGTGGGGRKAGASKAPNAKTNSQVSPAQWLIGLFIVLALISSLLMVLGKDISITGSLAVIAALWAAVIGAVLVTKYRRQADVAESRNRDLRLVYELQLEREIAARRQYEAEVETAVRQEVAQETNEEFEALKTQVLALRASLEKLLGNPLPEVPLALRPERRRELGSGLVGAGYSELGDLTDDRVAANLDFESTAPPAEPGRHAPAPTEYEYDSAEDAPSAVEMTEIIPVVTDEAPAADYTASEYEYTSSEYTALEYTETAAAGPEYGEQEYVEQAYGEQEYVEQGYSEQGYGEQGYGVEQQQYGAQQQYVDQQYTQAIPQQSGRQYADAYDAAAYEPPASPVSPVPPVPEVPPMPTRSRRAADDDGAHSAGQPASELLNRLRQGSGDAGGGRRRR